MAASSMELLIHLRRNDAACPAASIGLLLAQRLHAWTLGLHVVPIAAASFAAPEAVALYTSETETLYREALAWEPEWRATLGRHGLQGEWQVAQGDVVESLCHASRWCDLLVLERSQVVPDAPTGWGTVSRTIFNTSAPVLVITETARPRSVGSRIVIAWNESRGAMLAIRGALPLLARADQVIVLEGEPEENPFGLRYLPRPDLRAWLARHGIRAEFQRFTATREHGAAILDTAHALSADLIVMGAWGHSRLAEMVLGGTTRHLFQSSDLPLLVAH